MRRKCTETNECKNTETEELWKKIDFIKNINPNLYEISSLGRVKSFHDGKEKILQPRLYDRAYNVSLSSK